MSQRIRKFLIIISIGVLVSLTVLIIIIGTCAPDPTEPQANATAIPPSATLMPTATAIPTPECPSVGERVYFSTVADITVRIGEDLGELSSLSLEAGANWLLTQDSSWVLEVALVLSSFQVAADEISAIPAPQSVQTIHSDLLQIASSLRAVVPLYSRGVDNLDADLILAANQQIEEMGRLATVITGKVESFCE